MAVPAADDATSALRDREERLRRQDRVLLALARSRIVQGGDLEAALAEITRAASETLEVERVSVWLYDQRRSAIRCLCLYERSAGSYSSGHQLAAADYPAYFAALETERTLAADDARTDPRTRDFLATYLEPLGIGAMLDAPVRLGGRMAGVVCHEHVGAPRPWTAEAQSFAGSIADLTSLALEESERRRTERALADSERRFRRIVETSLEGIWEIDAETRIVYANRRMAEMLGYEIEDLLGRKAFDFVHPDSHAPGQESWGRRQQGVGERAEFLFVRKDGSLIWGDSSAMPSYDADGRFAGAVALVTDVTGRKRAEAELVEALARERAARADAEAASRTKDEFLATVSHELRTPLNAIASWLYLLRQARPDPAMLERGLATIERNVRAQAQLIDDILDVSRIVRGNLALAVGPVDLGAVLRQVLDSLRPAAEAKGVLVATEVDAAATTLGGDPDRLQQVVWNLLSNAIKFTPGGGRVEVRIERQGSHVHLVVADTGQGISPEFLPYVFERFRQADASTTRAHGGLGLGLAIVRHLVELHGGTVDVESAGPGRGSRFTVVLPAGEPRPSAEETIEGARPPGVLRGLAVLIVDDDADTREALALLLARAGARVATAGSAAEALAAVAGRIPDLLLADIGMPGEDGYDLLRRLRALPPERGGRVPAVALTAYARSEDRERSGAAGFQAHLAKPVDPDGLVALLAELGEIPENAT